MGLPIRITYRENADHFIEGFASYPQSTRPAIPEKHQRIFFFLVAIGALAYALVEQYRKGTEIWILILALLFFLLIGAFWIWFFKKIGLGKYSPTPEYKYTEKDRERLRARYIKQTGTEESIVTCEFGETGFKLVTHDGKSSAYEWAAMIRAVEAPRGIYIFIRKLAHLWFPRSAFASTLDYQDVIKLIGQKVRKFSRVVPSEMALIALGSNLGDSQKTILRAIDSLQACSAVRVLKSSLWQSTPVDCPPGSAMFVNAVVGLMPADGETPESLLAKLQALEKRFGRLPKQVMNEARPLDLDLIAFRNETRNTAELVLPHPRAAQRRFVLEPLAEFAPDLILPGQAKTVAELLAEMPPDPLMERIV